MSNVKELLFEYLERNGISIYRFSTKTGIPESRVRQWKKGNGSPKDEDAQIIRQFVTAKSENDLIENESRNNDVVGDKDLMILNLTEAIKRLTKSTEEVAANNTKMVDYLLARLTNSETSGSASQPAHLKGAGSSIPIDPVKKKLSGKRVLPSNDE